MFKMKDVSGWCCEHMERICTVFCGVLVKDFVRFNVDILMDHSIAFLYSSLLSLP